MDVFLVLHLLLRHLNDKRPFKVFPCQNFDLEILEAFTILRVAVVRVKLKNLQSAPTIATWSEDLAPQFTSTNGYGYPDSRKFKDFEGGGPGGCIFTDSPNLFKVTLAPC